MGAQQRGGGLLATLARLDRTKVFLGALVIAVLGFFLPGALGAVLLFAVVAALAALLGVTWSLTPPATRIFRLLVMAAITAIATTKLF